MSDYATRFADLLQQLESDGDVESFIAAAFADDPELVRPEAHQRLEGGQGARSFWQQYLAHFDAISSEFSRVVAAEGLGVLEWTSRGRLRGGGDIAYTGVSLLDLDDQGRVTRFATYYNTTPFHGPPSGRSQG